VGQERVLNGTLRFRDEFVRHKILDVIGDLALVGRPVLGHVVARNAGHALNHLLVREIVKAARRWEDSATRRSALAVEAPWEGATQRRLRVAAH
jgi:UDP-3-O-[3-hydroxymyristoyl] N-acetylglucosamine deacetylase